MLAPVVLFVYKRYEHTEKVLKALNENLLANESELFIFCDGARSEKDREDVEKTRKIAAEFSENSAFKKVEVRMAEKNSGLATSVINGVTEIINKYGNVIVLEDDLITTKDFLSYMNSALDFYEKNEKIWSISGFRFFDPEKLDYPHDVYMTYRGCSWGWATWKDRWEKVDWKVSDYASFRINPFKRRKFTVSGNDMPGMLDCQMKGFISSWAIRWCYQQSKLSMYTVFPKYTKIQNIGTDGSGTHSGNNHSYDVTLVENTQCKFENLDTDEKILKKYREKFNIPFINRTKAYIKHAILSKK